MKKPEQNNEREFITVTSVTVKRVNQYKDTVYFDININGIDIYGCRVVEGKNGDFIAFPSQKGKGKDGKERYFNHCYAALSDEDSKKILDTVEKMLND